MTTTLAALALATAVLVAIPGPNVALIVAHALRHGRAAAMFTVLGTTAGVALQLLLLVIGLAALIEFAAQALGWVRWAGVVWLLWLGVQTWRGDGDDAAAAVPRVFWRGLVIAAFNPKILLFNAAFLPQFLPPEPATTHVVAVAIVYLTVVLAGDLLWALFAAAAEPHLGRKRGLQRRLSGGFLIAAAIGLALARGIG